MALRCRYGVCQEGPAPWDGAEEQPLGCSASLCSCFGHLACAHRKRLRPPVSLRWLYPWNVLFFGRSKWFGGCVLYRFWMDIGGDTSESFALPVCQKRVDQILPSNGDTEELFQEIESSLKFLRWSASLYHLQSGCFSFPAPFGSRFKGILSKKLPNALWLPSCYWKRRRKFPTIANQ